MATESGGTPSSAYGPPHLIHEWNALTPVEQTEVQTWFTERKALTEAERVLTGHPCTTADHEDYPAWAVGIYDDGDYMDSRVYYCRECNDSLSAAGWYRPLITLGGTA